jgi:hypothetical protein
MFNKYVFIDDKCVSYDKEHYDLWSCDNVEYNKPFPLEIDNSRLSYDELDEIYKSSTSGDYTEFDKELDFITNARRLLIWVDDYTKK